MGATIRARGTGEAAVQHKLVDGAATALKANTFEGRNEKMAGTVGEVSVIGSADRTKARAAFETAAREAGEAFSSAFTKDGKKIEQNEGAYNKAMNAAGGIAAKHLGDLFPEMSKLEITGILQRATFSETLDLVAMRIAGTSEAVAQVKGGSAREIRGTLHAIAKGDYFEGNIDSMPIKGRAKFTGDELAVLDMATRLANATWMAGQVHRAAWEGNTGRIDPNVREAFNPYDLLMTTQFNRQFSEAKGQGLSDAEARKQAVTRVAFEVWKDVHQYQQLGK